MLAPATARRGGRRQRRDQPAHHRRPLRRHRPARRRAGHDEQLHLRQRDAPVLRNDLRRLGRRARLRRHRRRPDPHDQQPPHRPRSAGVALPGARGKLSRSGGLGRHGPVARRRRRRFASIRFLEPMTASILSNRRRVAPFGLNGGGRRRDRPQLRRAHRRHDRRASGTRLSADEPRRRLRHRDARRRWIRKPSIAERLRASALQPRKRPIARSSVAHMEATTPPSTCNTVPVTNDAC